MTEPLTAEQYAKAKDVCGRGTPGPWGFVGGANELFICADDERISIADISMYYRTEGDADDNANFIAYSRELLPAALAWIERAVPVLRVLAQQHDIPSWRRKPVQDAEALIAGLDAIQDAHPDYRSHI